MSYTIFYNVMKNRVLFLVLVFVVIQCNYRHAVTSNGLEHVLLRQFEDAITAFVLVPFSLEDSTTHLIE